MTGLTNKQEAFAQACAAGVPQSTAYRLIYNPSKTISKRNLYAAASRLAHHNKVGPRIAELKAEIAGARLWSREQSVMALVQLAGTGDSDVKPHEIISAIKELNAMHGFNAPAKIDLDVKEQGVTVITRVPQCEYPEDEDGD